jgi:nucleotide-binding universal stress UspA family protein
MSYVERWLSDHRVHANCTRVDMHATTEFSEIATHAKNVNANILVMGAFGHSRIRDFILGGVTKSVLANMTMPVLFSH